MKRLLAYLFIFLGFGLTYSANSEERNGTLRVPTTEKCNSLGKGGINWYYNNHIIYNYYNLHRYDNLNLFKITLK